jgi:hypothetical protein
MVEVIPWRPALDGPLREKALGTVIAVAERLRAPEHTEWIAGRVGDDADFPFRRQWSPLSVSYGHPAVALFFGQLDRCFPGQHWDRIAHGYLGVAARALDTIPISDHSLGLLGGLAGLCFTTRYLSLDGTRYQHLLRTLDDVLLQRAEAVFHRFDDNPRGTKPSDYDHIGGPTGVGAYLLLPPRTPGASSVVNSVLDRLIILSAQRGDRNGFFTPPDLQPTALHRERYPNGATDCGVAHGVPGPLALLALAQIGGVQRPGIEPAQRLLIRWLMTHRSDDAWGVNWPHVALPDSTTASHQPARAGWCYGSPGVARALWLAGTALRDADLQNAALEAIRAVYTRPTEVRGIASPILCHGIAGLLQIILRFAHDSDEDFLTAMACDLTRQLLDLFEPDSLVGFRNHDPEGRKLDNPGFLEGASGVALTLLAAATDTEPAWDRLLLLS